MSAPLAVIDTNVFIASIGSASPFRWLFDELLDGTFHLCLSTSIALEYEDVLARKTTPEVARNVAGLLRVLPNATYVEPHFRWHLIDVDPDDNKFVDAALAAGADCIVTHDTHFDVLKSIDFPKIEVLTAEAFRSLLLARS